MIDSAQVQAGLEVAQQVVAGGQGALHFFVEAPGAVAGD